MFRRRVRVISGGSAKRINAESSKRPRNHPRTSLRSHAATASHAAPAAEEHTPTLLPQGVREVRANASEVLAEPITDQRGRDLDGIDLAVLGAALLGREYLELLVLGRNKFEQLAR